MVEFIEADLHLHRDALVDLNHEYLAWIREQIEKRYGIDVSPPGGETVEEYAEKSIDDVLDLIPPEGICYLLKAEGDYVGMGAIREVRSGVGEIKRMYIKPGYRGRGIGSGLLRRLLGKGREFGFTRVFLETGKFMATAQNLYRSAGFVEREEYDETEVPPEIRHIWIFMEKDLRGSQGGSTNP